MKTKTPPLPPDITAIRWDTRGKSHAVIRPTSRVTACAVDFNHRASTTNPRRITCLTCLAIIASRQSKP